MPHKTGQVLNLLLGLDSFPGIRTGTKQTAGQPDSWTAIQLESPSPYSWTACHWTQPLLFFSSFGRSLALDSFPQAARKWQTCFRLSMELLVMTMSASTCCLLLNDLCSICRHSATLARNSTQEARCSPCSSCSCWPLSSNLSISSSRSLAACLRSTCPLLGSQSTAAPAAENSEAMC